LDRAGRAAQAAGAVIVAASGNDGPASPPRYPAAYDWAVAVTALDETRAPYARAVRGEHLDLAAPGVGLDLADREGRSRLHSGTSFAAPFVTAAMALAAQAAAVSKPADAFERVRGAAADLGVPGRDPIYGWGLLQVGPVCQTSERAGGNK
jgi:subtilisin family serine protease